MTKFIDYAVITEYIDGEQFGGVVAPCHVTVFGDSPNAQVRAAVWDPSTIEEIPAGHDRHGQPRVRVMPREPGFADWDHLTDASVEFSERDGTWTIRGTSDRLQREGDLAVADGQVEWRVKATGCQGC